MNGRHGFGNGFPIGGGSGDDSLPHTATTVDGEAGFSSSAGVMGAVTVVTVLGSILLSADDNDSMTARSKIGDAFHEAV